MEAMAMAVGREVAGRVPVGMVAAEARMVVARAVAVEAEGEMARAVPPGLRQVVAKVGAVVETEQGGVGRALAVEMRARGMQGLVKWVVVKGGAVVETEQEGVGKAVAVKVGAVVETGKEREVRVMAVPAAVREVVVRAAVSEVKEAERGTGEEQTCHQRR